MLKTVLKTFKMAAKKAGEEPEQ